MQVYLRLTDYKDKILTTNGSPESVVAVNSGSPFDAKYAQFIKVNDYSSDVEQTLNIGSQSTGAGAGKITFNPLRITKFLDTVSPVLFQMAASGSAFKTAEVFFVIQNAGASGLCIAKQTYKLVAVKTVAWSSSDADSAVLETVGFEYGGLIVSVSQQLPDGSMKSGAPAGWNRVKNISDIDPNQVIS